MSADDPGTDERQRKVAQSLGPLVEQEARRFLSESQIEGDPQRIAEGWERRFIADGRRAAEMIELYSQLGYEVVADPVSADEVGEDCDDCRLLAALQFKIIYTRKRATGEI
ncbi:MAG: hypothetical protein AMS21_06805 [Gemmatimonas sp. SG8_38_2]|nr:MAG: hypothetical protein AMS21_06805 [Gemmatimonas sp. SG8_38_2]